MKILSRDFYRHIGSLLNQEMKQSGFNRLKSGSLGWARKEGDEYLAVWLQCDKWGWEDYFGSSFTMEFQFAAEAVIGLGAMSSRMRFGKLIPEGDLALLKRMNNSVLAALPAPPAGHLYHSLPQDVRDLMYERKRPNQIEYIKGEDIWLHYYTLSDIEGWGKYFRDRMSGMLQSFREVTKRQINNTDNPSI